MKVGFTTKVSGKGLKPLVFSKEFDGIVLNVYKEAIYNHVMSILGESL